MYRNSVLNVLPCILIATALCARASASDIDGDGVLDSQDACCNTPAGVAVDAQGRPTGDLDFDCDVDLDDFAIFQANLTGALTPVPCPTCSDGQQNGDETGVDCGGSCAACTMPNGSACTLNSQCTSGFCVDGVCCNAACTSTCQACNIAGSTGTCTNIPSGQDPANECAGASTCNGTGACASPNGTACTLNSQCTSGFCVDGVCCNASCTSICQACNVAGSLGTCTNVPSGTDPANECAGASICNGAGACRSPNGSSCTLGSECLSGFCTDGFCCNTSCGGSCQACNVAGSVGSCTSIPSGQDPANECAGASTCNGAGACTP